MNATDTGGESLIIGVGSTTTNGQTVRFLVESCWAQIQLTVQHNSSPRAAHSAYSRRFSRILLLRASRRLSKSSELAIAYLQGFSFPKAPETGEYTWARDFVYFNLG